MKSLKEALIKKHAPYRNSFELTNPELLKLRHLDILETRDEGFWIYLDQDCCSPNLKNLDFGSQGLEAFTFDQNNIERLGIWNHYYLDLTRVWADQKEYDIVNVYRGVLNKSDSTSFKNLWNKMQQRLKEYGVADIPK